MLWNNGVNSVFSVVQVVICDTCDKYHDTLTAEAMVYHGAVVP